jgi:Flp pilus assembly protein TadG
MITRIRNQATKYAPAKQSGVYIVEFAIVGSLVLLVLFGSVEVSRVFFTVNMLEEATRRGARVAAVCPVDSPAINRAAIFNSSGTGTASAILPNLTTANVEVQYLDSAGVAVTDYAGDEARYRAIDFVRVQIVNYQHDMLIPGFIYSFQTRGYATTIPRESLGKYEDDQTSTCT